jgi:hypothetical protein
LITMLRPTAGDAEAFVLALVMFVYPSSAVIRASNSCIVLTSSGTSLD